MWRISKKPSDTFLCELASVGTFVCNEPSKCWENSLNSRSVYDYYGNNMEEPHTVEW